MEGLEGDGDGKPADCSRQLLLGCHRGVDEVSTIPFRTAGEGDTERRPEEKREKWETNKNKCDYVEDEVRLSREGL
jgi:hypothetical protein